MQMYPTWREKPEFGFLNINIVERDDASGQLIVEFRVANQNYVVTVDEDLIDQAKNTMPVLIIADVGEKNYLVDLPGESLSAGTRILVGTGDIKH